MTNSENALFAHAESALIGELSRSFLRPGVELVMQLQEGGFVGRLEGLLDASCNKRIAQALEVLHHFCKELESRGVEEARLMLEVDYNRLFVGPNRVLAPPYESYYDSEAVTPGGGRLRTQAERGVVQSYAQQGFQLDAEVNDLPDHIAVELEYLALLSTRESQAWEKDNAEEALKIQEDFVSFTQQHLKAWFGWFAQKVNEGARYPFYPAVASLVQECILEA